MVDALIGRVIASKFEIHALIGSGAMGAVYRARHLALDKFVAVKVLHQSVASDATFAARLRREAMAASRLDHPNSVRIVDFGEEPDGLLYIAMELLEGLDLFQVIERDWPMPYDRIVDLISQTLSALAVAHELGIVHRDLKPENVMLVSLVDDEGRPRDLVKVCDFGIAKILDTSDDPQRRPGGPAITMQNAIIGTPEYMSPEQCRGEPTDARSDLYSVGIVLYQLLAGRVPFFAIHAMDVLFKHLSEEPTPPSKLRPDVPPALEAVCLRALRKRPGERYATAREMRAELRAAAGPLGPRAHDPSSVPRLSLSAKNAETLTLPSASNPAMKSPAPTASDTINGTAPSLESSSKTPPQPRLRQAALLAIAMALLGAAAIVRPWRAPAPAPVPTAPLTPATMAEVASLPPEAPRVEAAREPAVDEAQEPAVQAAAAHPASPTVTHRPRNPAVTPAVAGASQPVFPAPPEPHPLALAAAPAAASSPPPSTKSLDAPPPAAATHIDPPVRTEGGRVADPAGLAARAPVRRGRVSWTVTGAGGGATTGTVAHALARAGPAWQRCYDSGLSASSGNAEGNAAMHLTCDEQGRVVGATLSGFDLGDVASCIRASTAGITIPNADTGDAWASVAFTFKVIE